MAAILIRGSLFSKCRDKMENFLRVDNHNESLLESLSYSFKSAIKPFRVRVVEEKDVRWIVRNFHTAHVEKKTEFTIFQEISLKSLPQ